MHMFLPKKHRKAHGEEGKTTIYFNEIVMGVVSFSCIALGPSWDQFGLVPMDKKLSPCKACVVFTWDPYLGSWGSFFPFNLTFPFPNYILTNEISHPFYLTFLTVWRLICQIY